MRSWFETRTFIAAVKVLSINETAMPADGPMYVDGKVLKFIKGGLRTKQRIRFGASAWVGPTYRPGQERIVFLSPVARGHTYYAKASWSSLEAGKFDMSFVNASRESSDQR